MMFSHRHTKTRTSAQQRRFLNFEQSQLFKTILIHSNRSFCLTYYFLLSSLATHSALTGAWTERIFFSVPNDLKDAKLHVRAFTKADAGVYRCRVDFYNSATKNSRVNVTLIGKLADCS